MLITSQCAVVTFSLMGEDVIDRIDGVDVFKYLELPLDWLEDN